MESAVVSVDVSLRSEKRITVQTLEEPKSIKKELRPAYQMHLKRNPNPKLHQDAVYYSLLSRLYQEKIPRKKMRPRFGNPHRYILLKTNTITLAKTEIRPTKCGRTSSNRHLKR